VALTGTLLADFSAFKAEGDKSLAVMKQMESGADTASAKLSKLGSGFNIKEAINDPLSAGKTLMGEYAESIGPVGVAGLAATGVLVAMGAASFKLATDAAHVGAAFDDMADKTGLSVPVLSKYSNAAQVIGVDMNTLTDVVFKLERGLGENTAAFQSGLKTMGTSTEELKAAGPDRYLELVTAGLRGIPDPAARAAAGNAVLGRGYKDVAAALMDLDAGMKLTADLSPWTAKQAADAEAFEFQIASIKTHISATATAIGNELIPAAGLLVDVLARTGTAAVHVADLGGLVSGAWKGVTLTLGEGALAAETANAVAGTTNRLFSEQGATAQSVAAKLLEMGFSEKTVADQTGLLADEVRKLNGDLHATRSAAEEFDALWERVNTALAKGPPTLDGVSASTRGLAADMKAAGVPLKDIAAATGLSLGQLGLLDKKITDTAASTVAWRKATDELVGALVPWQTSLDSINGATVEAIKFELSAGVSQGTLATAYGLTAQQIKAVVIALEEEAAAMASTADFEKAAGDRRLEITRAMTKATNDLVLADLNRKQMEGEASDKFLAGALADAQAQDALNQVVGQLPPEIAKIPTALEASQSAFAAFKGVVVAGTGEMINSLSQFSAASTWVQDRVTRLDAQRARGGFFIDTGASGQMPVQTRDSGGPVTAGTSYLIGGGNAPELFTPGASGFVTPGGGGGSVVVQNVFHLVDTEANLARRVSEQILRSVKQGQQLAAFGK
jgi:hypothetical protein